jgi:hypothetical protein
MTKSGTSVKMSAYHGLRARGASVYVEFCWLLLRKINNFTMFLQQKASIILICFVRNPSSHNYLMDTTYF